MDTDIWRAHHDCQLAQCTLDGPGSGCDFFHPQKCFAWAGDDSAHVMPYLSTFNHVYTCLMHVPPTACLSFHSSPGLPSVNHWLVLICCQQQVQLCIKGVVNVIRLFLAVCACALQGNVITPTVSGLRQWQQVFNWWESATTPIPSVNLVKAATTILGRENPSSMNVFECVDGCFTRF